MAKLQAGILSPPIGKVSGVVGFKWKDRACLRGYVVPAYTNTTAQSDQRGYFGAAAKFASGLLGQCLQPHMDPWIRSMSAYNDFIKQNMVSFQAEDDPDSYVITRGPLTNSTVVLANYEAANGNLIASWSSILGNNGLATDIAHLVIYDISSKIFYFGAGNVQRTTATETVVIPQALTFGNLYVFLYFSQTIDSILRRVATSVVCKATVHV